MAKPVVITCAITGSHQDFARHPDYPITPQAIARDCIAAGKAGAAVVHVHVRDPETGWPSIRLDLFSEVVARVRDSGSEVLINLTTGEGAVFQAREDDPSRSTERFGLLSPEDRVRHIEALRPDICTLDITTMNFGEFVFINAPEHLRRMARRIIAAGVQPELEVFDLGQIVLARKLIQEGVLPGPHLFQLCLGIQYGAPATPRVMTLMVDMLPRDAVWSAFGVGPLEFDVVAQAVSLGGNVRVGLEDNLYLGRGEWATNAALVDRAASIVTALGRDVASPQEAAALLGVRARRDAAA
jgi:uncharacterized protein (DUF849 family)